jgi:hypothetical protein
MCGKVRTQFTQLNVQKSSNTTFRLNPVIVNGGLFSHPRNRENSGA